MNHSNIKPGRVSAAAALALACCAMLGLGGCAGPTQVDRQFGQSLKQVLAKQVIYPEAGRNRDPVSGIDGQAAAGAYATYQKSFVAPEPQTNALTIGIGGKQ